MSIGVNSKDSSDFYNYWNLRVRPVADLHSGYGLEEECEYNQDFKSFVNSKLKEDVDKYSSQLRELFKGVVSIGQASGSRDDFGRNLSFIVEKNQINQDKEIVTKKLFDTMSTVFGHLGDSFVSDNEVASDGSFYIGKSYLCFYESDLVYFFDYNFYLEGVPKKIASDYVDYVGGYEIEFFRRKKKERMKVTNLCLKRQKER